MNAVLILSVLTVGTSVLAPAMIPIHVKPAGAGSI